MFIHGIMASVKPPVPLVFNPYSLANVQYSGKSFVPGTTNPADTPFFDSTGTKMYHGLGALKGLREHTLSTAWDISTASQDFVYTDAGISQARGTFFKPDGTKFYIIDAGWDTVWQYSCSTAWDLSTATKDGITTADISVNTPAGFGLWFKSDGTKFYTTNSATTLQSYSCSTPWDVSSASVSFDGNVHTWVEATDIRSIWMTSDGLQLFAISYLTNVFRYTLGTAWDFSTIAYASEQFDYGAQESYGTGVAIGDNGNYMYITGEVTDDIFQYNLLAV